MLNHVFQSHKGQVHDFFLENLDATGLSDLHIFKEKAGVFKTLNDKNISESIIYWNTAKVKHPNLSQLAIKLLQLPASSA